MTAPSRFDDLLRLWRDGDASLDELSELEALLRSDPRYRRSLARSIQTEVDLYARHARGASAPPVRRWRMEAVAAAFAVAVSLLAVSYVLLRPPEAPGRLKAGTVRVDGASARAFKIGSFLEVPAEASARLTLQDHLEAWFDGGTAGTFVEPGLFDLRRGGGSFAASRPLRVVTPEGALSAAGANFSARLDVQGLRVAVVAGAVEVEYDGLRHTLQSGENVSYLRLAGRKRGDAREAEKRVREAGIDLAAAMDKAVQKARGTPVAASLDRENGKIEFSVRVVRGGKLREITLDAKSGTVLDDDGEDEDRNAVAAALKWPLRDAIAAALAKVPGAAMEAEAELKGGRVFAEIEILSGGRLYEVAVDLEAGALISVGPDTP